MRQGLRFLRPSWRASWPQAPTFSRRACCASGEIEALARQDKGCARLMTVPDIGRSSRAQWWLQSAPAIPSRKAATSAPGSDWCRARCRPATARSLERYRSAAIVTCALYSVRQQARPHRQGGSPQGPSSARKSRQGRFRVIWIVWRRAWPLCHFGMLKLLTTPIECYGLPSPVRAPVRWRGRTPSAPACLVAWPPVGFSCRAIS